MLREDLAPAHQLIQSVHAAHEAGIRYGNPDDTSSMVILTVPDEVALRTLSTAARSCGIKTYLFEEEDLGGQATAFATEPISGEARRFFRKLPMWTPESEEVHG